MGNFPYWASAHDIFSWMAMIPLSLQSPNTHIKFMCVHAHRYIHCFPASSLPQQPFLFRAIKSIRFTFRSTSDYQPMPNLFHFPQKLLAHQLDLYLLDLTEKFIFHSKYSNCFYTLAPMNSAPSTVLKRTLLSGQAGILYHRCWGYSFFHTFIHACLPCNILFLSCIYSSVNLFTYSLSSYYMPSTVMLKQIPRKM